MNNPQASFFVLKSKCGLMHSVAHPTSRWYMHVLTLYNETKAIRCVWFCFTLCHYPSFTGSTYSIPLPDHQKVFSKFRIQTIDHFRIYITKNSFEIRFAGYTNCPPLPDHQKAFSKFSLLVLQTLDLSHITQKHFWNSVHRFLQLKTTPS